MDSKSFSWGWKRIKILKYVETSDNFLNCEVEVVEDENKSKDLEPLALGLIKKFDRLQVLNKKDLNDGTNNIKNLKDPSLIANNISANLNIQIFEKQELLETIDLKKKLEKIHQLIEKETSVLSVEKKIRGRVKNQMEKTQREYYLNEQLKAIQKELGEIDEGKDELSSLSKALLMQKCKISKRKMFIRVKN